jgi:hypothetical protein
LVQADRLKIRLKEIRQKRKVRLTTSLLPGRFGVKQTS